MQIGVSVSIPASLSVRTTSSAASVPSTPSYLPPVGCVSRWEPRPTGAFDMSRPLRRPNIEPSASTWTSSPAASQAFAEPVAHLLVLGSQRQPPHAAFRRGAEFGGFVNGVPQPGGVDLQVGGDFCHWPFRSSGYARRAFSMTRLRRRVNNDAALREIGGEFGHAFHRDRIRGGQPARRKRQQRQSAGWSTAIAAAHRPFRFRRSRSE